MIDIKNKVDCCGCKACGDICPKDAITFKVDEEGFWYPFVNEDKCIDCGLCEKVCPILHPDFSKLNHSHTPATYIIQMPDANDRLASASGAAYTLLAREVFKQGGYVAGHIWDGKSKVKGYISGNPKDLDILRGTKYLQSDTEGMFLAVREVLKTGKLVLFSGCPCQVAAIRRFLRKDYENLITTDFTCMGIDSPLAFAKYIESLEREYASEILLFKAKAKEVGWRHLTNKAIFANGRTYYGINGEDANLKATFLNLLVRPSCYDCKFKGFPRISDITIGDYWRKKYDYDPLDDNTGTSYLILNNKKAEDFFENCKSFCLHRQTTHTEILGANPLSVKSLSLPSVNRKEFYDRIGKQDFKYVVDDYISQQNKRKKKSYKESIKLLLKILIFYRRNIKSFFYFLYYNFFSKRIKTNFWQGNILLPVNVKLNLKDKSCVYVKGLNIIDCRAEKGQIRLMEQSNLYLNSNILGDRVDISMRHGANLLIGNYSELKKNVRIKLTHNVTIGDFSLIADGVVIDDTNSEVVLFNEMTDPDPIIRIGTHVLLGRGAVIKRGTELGDETIVQEFSVVAGKFQPRIVLGGCPAKEVNSNINWKYNFKRSWNYKM